MNDGVSGKCHLIAHIYDFRKGVLDGNNDAGEESRRTCIHGSRVRFSSC